jgi:CRP-like cAMP-binding protein
MQTHTLILGDVLQEAMEGATDVYFPYAGMVSIVTVLEDGTAIEAATTGREGAVNPLAAMGNVMGSHSLVQLPGAAGRIPSATLRRLSPQTPLLQQALRRYLGRFVQQVMQTAACNAVHPVQQRLPRWLLQVHDRAGGDQFFLTQEFLSQMLGIHRPSVTVAASELQRAGLIRYRRGHIEVLDRAALEAAACECYAIIRDGEITPSPGER